MPIIVRGWRRVAPTLAAPSYRSLTRGLAAALFPQPYVGTLERQLQTLFPRARSVGGYSTGRGALAAAITLAMQVTGRRTVVLPAYTSYSVAAAAAAAGARVRLVDLAPGSLDVDVDCLRARVDPDTAAVLLGNLFGFPSSVAAGAWLSAQGTLVIDDAAQALGATADGVLVGGRGDLGVLSFGRGKCVTMGDGGALLVNRPALAHRAPGGPGHPRRGFTEWSTAVAVRVAALPGAFGVLSRLPGARIGESTYDPQVERLGVPASVDGMSADLPDAVRRQHAVRQEVARWWFEAVGGIGGLTCVQATPGTVPVYLRVPVLVADRATRARIEEKLSGIGLAFVRSYPTTLGAIPAFREACGLDEYHAANAEALADRLLALPCHASVKRVDVERAARVIRDDLRRRPSP